MHYPNCFPKRHNVNSFDNWLGDIPGKAQDYKFDDEDNLYIHGQVGSGKTHLMTAIIKKIKSEWDINFLFINAIELLDEIRSTFDANKNKKYNSAGYEEHQPDTDDVMRKYSSVALLAIDDLGSEKGSEWVSETFFKGLFQMTF